ncbi:MAG: hypothetical protein ACQSGP_22335 [Frankia sp.]
MHLSRAGRWLAAACQLAVGRALVIASSLSPGTSEPNRAAIDTYATHLGRVDGALAVEVVVVLLGPAIALAALLARSGSPRLAAVAGWTGLVSGSAWIALLGVDLATRAAVDTNRDASATLLKNLTALPQFQVFVLLALLGGLVAFVCLGIALWRARPVPRWAAAALMIYEPLNFLTGDAGPAPRAGASVLLLVGLAACAVAILRHGLPGPAYRPAGNLHAELTGPAAATAS